MPQRLCSSRTPKDWPECCWPSFGCSQGRIGSQRMLRAAVRGVLGRCSDGDVDAAVEVLGACVRRTTGGRGATKYTLDVARLPPELRDWIASKP